MIKFLLPLIGLLVGLGSGAGVALVIGTGSDDDAGMKAEEVEEAPKDTEIVKLPNQFVIPVIVNERVLAMVILTVALEVEAGSADHVRSIEPKLRDAFIGELFGLAALGGFDDDVVSRQTLELVRMLLSERAQTLLSQKHAKVLITDMARQDP